MKKVAGILIAIMVLASCVEGKTERMRFTDKSPVFSLDGGQKEVVCKNYSHLFMGRLYCGQDRATGNEINGLTVTVSENVINLTCEPSRTPKKWTLYVNDGRNALGSIKITQK